jgi:hypothetical protein
VAARVAVDFPAIAPGGLLSRLRGASIRCRLSTPTAKPTAPASAGVIDGSHLTIRHYRDNDAMASILTR